MSLPFGRGGRGLAIQRLLEQQTPGAAERPSSSDPSDDGDSSDGPRRETPVVSLGRGMPGRGLRIVKAVEEQVQAERSGSASVGRGGGLSLLSTAAKAPAAAPAPAVSTSAAPQGLRTNFGRGSIGRGLRPTPAVDTTVSDLTQRVQATSLAGTSDVRSVSSKGDKQEPAERPVGAQGQREGRRRREPLQPVGPDDKHGQGGQPTKMTANYIRVRCQQEFVHQYSVEFRPPIDARLMRIKIMSTLPASSFGGLSSEARAFDGRILYLPSPLANAETVIKTEKPTDDSGVFIKITFTNKTPIISCPAVYNVIFRRVQHELRMTQVGRHYYDPSKKIDIKAHRLEIWPGYVTTITRYEGGLLLMCDVSHKVIRQETVYDIIRGIVTSDRDSNITPRMQTEIINQIVGQTVLTRYRNATYRIDDIDFKRHPMHTFLRNNQEISFVKYFKEQYNIHIQDPNQPLLLHRAKQFAGPGNQRDAPVHMISLIPELCYITGLTDEMRANFRLMKAIHQHTRVSPEQRHAAMKKFIRSVKENGKASSIMGAWGMSLEDDTVDLMGRTLQPEAIIFGGDKRVEGNQLASFKKEIGFNNVISHQPMKQWLIVCCAKQFQKVNEFIQALQNRGKRVGMRIAEPRWEKLNDDRTESFLRAIRNNITPETQMVVAVFPTLRTDRYNAFKKLTCVECPVPSQGLLFNTINDPKKMTSVALNVALQMNVKMGGELWAVSVPLKKFMVVGVDAYHCGKQRSKSVYGMCCSMNHACTRYYSRAMFQDSEGQEFGHRVQSIMTDMLKHYVNTNNFLPDHIFFYRDGVGDGMLQSVQSFEIPQVMRAFKAFGEDYKPRMVFNVVQKRISTRIFLPTQREMANPRPGTVLDHTVTRTDRYDFYLVPQSVNQGTVTPSHFVVLFDSSGLRPDHIQQMAYKQCHLYYNWPGTIRTPAACLYAHKLAYMVGQTLLKEPSAKLLDRLFFI